MNHPQEIGKLIDQEKSVDLRPYFWPHFKRGNENKSIFRIPDYAVISSASFARTPAVFRDRRVLEYYQSLAREYFIDE